MGRRELRVARPATARARAGSGTARTAEDRPSTDAKPGSSRSSGGMSRSSMGTGPGYRRPGPLLRAGSAGPATVPPGPVHGGVGGSQQVLGVHAGAGVGGAEAHADGDLPPAGEDDRRLEDSPDPALEVLHHLVVRTGHDHHELVAAEAGDEVAIAHDAGEPPA